MEPTATIRERPKGDLLGTGLALGAHVVLVILGLILTPGIAMSTAACAYHECGDDKWIGYALGLLTYGAAAVFLVVLVVTLWFMWTRRRAVPVPLIGCTLQVLLIGAAMEMMRAAGPIDPST